jgi:hypothetical protein
MIIDAAAAVVDSVEGLRLGVFLCAARPIERVET